MSIDSYTKAVLTIIAACLVWLCAASAALPLRAQQRAPALAAAPAQPVVIVGWGTLDAEGRVKLTMNGDRANPMTDPNLPVKVIGYPMPTRALDVRLEYSEGRPLPVGISSIKRTGDWEPIRSAVEPEPVRPRPGRN
jgi:hypothetical protein